MDVEMGNAEVVTAQPGPRSGLAAKQRANASEILNAAAKAFGKRGYAATSIDDVADLLGCTKGRIYHYFRTKGDLFFGIHHQAMEWALEAVVPTANDPDLGPTDKLHEMVRCHAIHMMEHSDFVGPSQFHVEMNLAREGRNKDAQMTALFDMRQQFENCFLDVVKAGVGSGEFRSGDVNVLTKAVLGAVNWMNVWYRPGPSDVADDRERMAQELADFAVGGVRAT